jgi:tetratricopeptide (TPR) repeat protein
MILNKMISALSFSSEVWMSLLLGAVVTLIIAYIIYRIQKKETIIHKQDHDAKLEEIKILHQQDSEKIRVLYELIVQSQRGSIGEAESATLEQKIEVAADLITEKDSDKAQALKAIAEKDKKEADLLLDKLSKYEHDLEELYNLHAMNEHRNGNYPDSAAWLEKLVALKPDNLEYKQRLFNDHNSAGHFDIAEKLARETITALQSDTGSDPKKLVQWLYCLGSVFIRRRNDVEAEKHLNQALELGISIYGPEHPEIYNIYNDLGIVWLSRRELAKAEEYLSIAQRIKTVEDDDDVVSKAFITFNLASVNMAQDKMEEALKLYEEGRELIFDRLSDDHPALTFYYRNAGYLYYKRADFDVARDFMQKGIDIFRKKNMTTNPDYIHPLNMMGHILYHMKEYEEADKFYLEALEVLEKNQSDGFAGINQVRKYLAENYLQWGKYDKVETILSLIITDLEARPAEARKGLESVYRLLADSLTRQGRDKEAETYLSKADELKARLEAEKQPAPAEHKE